MDDTPIDANSRVALIVEYDGACFNGWQLQAGSDASSVQSALETALGTVADNPVRVFCAGRTDTGVHATQQVVHFDAPVSRSSRSWLLGSNVHLPASVVVRAATSVPVDFHARFSATARRYRYLILNRQVASPLLDKRAWWLRYDLNVENMHTASQHLLGEQDFSAFRAASCQSSTPMRCVDFIEVTRHREFVVIDIQANAFLHHMVRNIVGALVAVGRQRISPADVAALLEGRDRTVAPDTAPPDGLYLVSVTYPQNFNIPLFSPGPSFLD